MRIGVIGGSSAGIFASLLIKKEHPDWEVTILEKNDRLGKKLLATGNGRCNILNQNISSKNFNDPSFVESLNVDCSFELLNRILNKDLGILTKNIDGYIYPLSLSAKCVVSVLEKEIKDKGINAFLNTSVTKYHGTSITTNEGTFSFDKLIFCTGGKSQKNLGSDGSLFEEFKNHKYRISNLEPALCPLIVKENVGSLNGVRVGAKVKITGDLQGIFEESGEVLFKKDGLSGIVIFNASRFVKNTGKYQISLDLFEDLTENDLFHLLQQQQIKLGCEFLKSMLPEKLALYFKNMQGDTTALAHMLKNWVFNFEGKYPFEDSQVTKGGILTNQLSNSLESKIEKNVFFIGEVVDIDGPCGGYNLGWCLLSSLAVSKGL